MPNQSMALANALDPRVVAQWMAKFGPGIGRPPSEGPRGQQQGYGRPPGAPPMGSPEPPPWMMPQGMPPPQQGMPPPGPPMQGGVPPNLQGCQQLPSGQFMPK